MNEQETIRRLRDALDTAADLIALCQRLGCAAGPVAIPSEINDAIALADASITLASAKLG